ncbi:molybdate ABC transporter ATP-binding protein ModF [Providencia heimbachae]|uniref:Putative ATP-binding component of an ABC superfamily molybdenum transporter n=1 Tax=Providencia heimbachae ATCC 35613 TaxID=1354272 RepID=A0A1B7JZV9_9GAMM|nr:molybdate ABC transporter ATP-binding protein ModF [Providencia heimbachae]OAT53426.1 putative ATP-binding component of an ABC superfamily molybdenum transporter [Providencia heimbachae ATCC 35613]SQH14162.1 Putative HMP/thiamine import ATP-binding protein YkoD [Providencia heimbachae]
MSSIKIQHASFKLSDTQTLNIAELEINKGESWAFIGANGSGKSSLARVLSGELHSLSGIAENTFNAPIRLSFEQLQKIINEEWQRNNTDLLSEDEEDTGYTAAEIIQLNHKDNEYCLELAAKFGISDLLSRRFKYLSTGETRKVLLCQILMAQPDLLVLDEPFDGLDVYSRSNLSELLSSLSEKGLTLIIILNRFDELPDFINNMGVVADCKLTLAGNRESVLANTLINQLQHSEKIKQLSIPQMEDPSTEKLLDDNTPRIILRNGVISYNDKPILHGLNWQVNANEHWQIIGENGAGKSTLLSLITGDHPQGYSNDLTLFGRRRGSGETIWDIKRHIGYVSNSIHQEYRVSTSVINVIISGFHDSIGLYQTPSDRQIQLAREWLALLGFPSQTAQQPFHRLSWGQQRLVLIARALVKHPAMLILDEPLQGLDGLNRLLVLRFIDVMLSQGTTQLLFVTHHQEDAPTCITHRLTFVPDHGKYRYNIEIL